MIFLEALYLIYRYVYILQSMLKVCTAKRIRQCKEQPGFVPLPLGVAVAAPTDHATGATFILLWHGNRNTKYIYNFYPNFLERLDKIIAIKIYVKKKTITTIKRVKSEIKNYLPLCSWENGLQRSFAMSYEFSINSILVKCSPIGPHSSI